MRNENDKTKKLASTAFDAALVKLGKTKKHVNQTVIRFQTI